MPQQAPLFVFKQIVNSCDKAYYVNLHTGGLIAMRYNYLSPTFVVVIFIFFYHFALGAESILRQNNKMYSCLRRNDKKNKNDKTREYKKEL